MVDLTEHRRPQAVAPRAAVLSLTFTDSVLRRCFRNISSRFFSARLHRQPKRWRHFIFTVIALPRQRRW